MGGRRGSLHGVSAAQADSGFGQEHLSTYHLIVYRLSDWIMIGCSGRLQVIKRTEAFVGTASFSGFDVGAGTLMDVSAAQGPNPRDLTYQASEACAAPHAVFRGLLIEMRFISHQNLYTGSCLLYATRHSDSPKSLSEGSGISSVKLYPIGEDRGRRIFAVCCNTAL